MDSTEKDIVYGVLFDYIQRGRTLTRFFAYKKCKRVECENQVKAKMVECHGFKYLPSNQRHRNAQYCSRSCANIVRSYAKKLKAANKNKHMNKPDTVQKFISPDMKKPMEAYMI